VLIASQINDLRLWRFSFPLTQIKPRYTELSQQVSMAQINSCIRHTCRDVLPSEGGVPNPNKESEDKVLLFNDRFRDAFIGGTAALRAIGRYGWRRRRVARQSRELSHWVQPLP
jgi:hypothetical protein